ncbi:MAG: MBL fold metallo-hydrolase [Lentisphaeria bacterium]|nr:MBL fold metallo-hydrolase [Lentisphaeria bacterium]
MKLITLGTGHGSPTMTRDCSSSVLEVNGSLYLFDAGAPVNALMIRKSLPFEKLRAVFISHSHEDHIGGLPGLIKSLARRQDDGPQTRILLPEEQTVEAVTAFVAATHRMWDEKLLALTAVSAGVVYQDENIRVTAYRTQHFDNENKDFPSFAFAVEAEEKKIVFTGDVSRHLQDFPVDAFDREAVCVMECQHYRPEIAGEVLRKLPVKRFIGVHISDKWNSDPDGFKAALGDVDFPVVLAADGMEFEL